MGSQSQLQGGRRGRGQGTSPWFPHLPPLPPTVTTWRLGLPFTKGHPPTPFVNLLEHGSRTVNVTTLKFTVSAVYSIDYMN